MTPTQVVRWCKTLKDAGGGVKRLIVENVPEFLDWGPVSRETGKPRKERKGCNFRGWVRDLKALGFKVEWRLLNAADYGDATTRTRFFLMARSDGGAIRWPAATHTKTGPFSPRFQRWRSAREVIDWKRRGKSIFTRKKPLAAKTLLRIYAGAVRFGWPAVFRVKLALYMRSLGIAVPDLGSGPAQGDLFDPAVVVLRKHADVRSVDAPRSTGEPIPTIPTEGAHALIAPVTHADASMRARSVDAPLPTVTGAARGELAFVVGAFGERPGQTPRVHSIDEPAPTLCAQGRVPLVHGVTAAELEAVDILFRMLEPDELALAMGFPRRYRFTGNKTERTRQIGNAVAVNVARALVAALMEVAA